MAWSNPAFEDVAHTVRVETGLSLAATNIADTESRIRRAMAAARVADVHQYLRLLRSNHVPLDDLVIEFTVGETYFFRDPQHFDFIRSCVVPDLVRRRGPDHPVRIWSAGCASGEEAYSLAILLDEQALDGHVMATDISRPALQRGRDGVYRRWSLRGLNAATVARWFTDSGSDWTLDPRLRKRVTFLFHNLAQPGSRPLAAGLGGMDLILCRNVLIYLERAVVGEVAERFAEALTDEGWLITGPSDPPLNGVAGLTPFVTEHGVFYRKARPQPTLPGTTRESARPAEAVRRPAPEFHVACGAAVSSNDGTHGARRDDVRTAFEEADYARVIALTDRALDPAAAAIRVRAVGNRDGEAAAVAEIERQIRDFPRSPELHVLHGILLIGAHRLDPAARALRRAMYLDPSLIIAQFLLASVMRRQGAVDEARRAYASARDAARLRPSDEPLSFADGERAGTIATIAEAEIHLIDTLRSLPR